MSARKGGDSALAELLLRRAAAFDSDSSYVAALLADTLLANAQPELAKRWAERALEKDPESDLARGVMSRLGS